MKYINLIPMAGLGKRFKEKGYTVPKPLIRIDGRFMISRAASSLPRSDGWIFVCSSEHEKEASIGSALKQEFHGAKVISIDYLTEGQACTCMLAEPLLDGSEVLTIGACDNAMIYNKEMWSEEIDKVDILVWTFKGCPAVLDNPDQYSWALEQDGLISMISLKKSLSLTPQDDHALVGAFSFRKAREFFEAGREMHRMDRRVNGEFYVDELVNVAIQSGLKAKVFEVEYYIGWGTPEDLRNYHYWKKCLDEYQ